MREVFDNRLYEKQRRRRRHKNASKATKSEVRAAVAEIRADTEPLTVEVKSILSARRMAEAEFEGVEFVKGERQDPRALRILRRLWPFKADAMIRRLKTRGVVLSLE